MSNFTFKAGNQPSWLVADSLDEAQRRQQQADAAKLSARVRRASNKIARQKRLAAKPANKRQRR